MSAWLAPAACCIAVDEERDALKVRTEERSLWR
jgi:hypothetical protein